MSFPTNILILVFEKLHFQELESSYALNVYLGFGVLLHCIACDVGKLILGSLSSVFYNVVVLMDMQF